MNIRLKIKSIEWIDERGYHPPRLLRHWKITAYSEKGNIGPYELYVEDFPDSNIIELDIEYRYDDH